MNLFKDIYKSANNDIIPDPSLLNKILSSEPKSKRVNFYKYTTVAAACIIVAGAIFAYPRINEINTQDNMSAVIQQNTYEGKADAPQKDIVTTKAPESTQPPISTPEWEKISGTNNDARNIPAATTKPVPTDTPPVSLPSNTPTSSTKRVNIDAIIKAQQKAEIEASPTAEEMSDVGTDSSQVSAKSSETELPIQTASANEAENTVTAVSEDQTEVNSEMFSVRSANGRMAVLITEEDATAIADTEFLADFGEEFILNTEVKIVYEDYYTVTRFSDSDEKSIIVYDNGSIEKLY